MDSSARAQPLYNLRRRYWVPLIRAGLHSAIAGSKRNFVLGDYMRSEHIDSLAAELLVNIYLGVGDATLGAPTASARAF